MNGAQGKLGHVIRLAAKYTMVVAQEMDIPCGQMGLYASMLRKANTQIRFGDPMHIGDQAGQHARVSNIASDGMVLLDTQFECDELMALKRTGRWKECVLYGDDGSSPIIVANLYGISEATSAACIKLQDEIILKTVIMRAMSFQDIPYFITGDFNCKFSASHCASAAIACGALYDVGSDHGVGGPTFSNAKGGINPQSAGPGTSRIDYVCANAAGANIVTKLWVDWEATRISDHVVLGVECNLEQYTR